LREGEGGARSAQPSICSLSAIGVGQRIGSGRHDPAEPVGDPPPLHSSDSTCIQIGAFGALGRKATAPAALGLRIPSVLNSDCPPWLPHNLSPPASHLSHPSRTYHLPPTAFRPPHFGKDNYLCCAVLCCAALVPTPPESLIASPLARRLEIPLLPQLHFRCPASSSQTFTYSSILPTNDNLRRYVPPPTTSTSSRPTPSSTPPWTTTSQASSSWHAHAAIANSTTAIHAHPGHHASKVDG